MHQVSLKCKLCLCDSLTLMTVFSQLWLGLPTCSTRTAKTLKVSYSQLKTSELSKVFQDA